MDTSKIIEILNKIIDTSARNLVGKTCKRVEVLDNNKSLTPDLYKAIVKELIYEESRITKQMLRSVFIPSVVFISKEDKKWIIQKF